MATLAMLAENWQNIPVKSWSGRVTVEIYSRSDRDSGQFKLARGNSVSSEKKKQNNTEKYVEAIFPTDALHGWLAN